MSVLIVGAGDVEGHAPSRALARRLRAVGNAVEVRGRATPPRRLLPWGRSHGDADGIDVVVPATRGDIELALAVGGDRPLLAPPSWGVPADRDVAWRAPSNPHLSSSPSGGGLGFHASPVEPGLRPRPTRRHDGATIAIVARWTDKTPARYLALACEEAGMSVLRLDRLDRDAVPPEAVGIVVVESPLPVLSITGDDPGVPVLLWAHHGEHHTDTQVRACRHYGVDGVLLAHSWHLAHAFPRPVHRFPFGVPSELVVDGPPWEDRPYDVAFVGSGVGGAGTYSDRGQMLEALAAATAPARSRIETGINPVEMAQLYARSKVVPNDCGNHHRPITMRVSEAVAAGALLLTEAAPGLDHVYSPGMHYAVLDDDPGAQLRELLADPASGQRARAAREHALSHHTTRHRVDDLVDVLAATPRHAPLVPPPAPDDPLLRPIAADLLLDDVLPLGVSDAEAQLPDRVVWPEQRLARLADRPLAHAVVVSRHWSGSPQRAVAAARRLLVAPADRNDILDLALARGPDVRAQERDGVVAVDLGAPGYRVMGLWP